MYTRLPAFLCGAQVYDSFIYGPDTQELLESLNNIKHNWYEYWKPTDLVLSDYNISRIPEKLPNYLSQLIMQNIPIEELPCINAAIWLLNIVNAPLRNIGTFTNTLTIINLTNIHITTLPPLPQGLKRLSLTDIPSLTSLPALPFELTDLSLVNLGLKEVPPLPKGLQYLTLKNLPNLLEIPTPPITLIKVWYYDLPIGELPAHNMCIDLLEFMCKGKNIKKLPPLPKSIDRLECDNTEVKEIPRLPNLKCLNIANTPIEDLDGGGYKDGKHILPTSIRYIDARNTSIKILPFILVYLLQRNINATYYFGYCPLLLKNEKGESSLRYMDRWHEWHRMEYEKYMTQKQCRAIKEELMAAAWHPRRFERWLETGDENLVN